MTALAFDLFEKNGCNNNSSADGLVLGFGSMLDERSEKEREKREKRKERENKKKIRERKERKKKTKKNKKQKKKQKKKNLFLTRSASKSETEGRADLRIGGGPYKAV